MVSECTVHNNIILAIFVPKIIKVGGNLTKLCQKQFRLFLEMVLWVYSNIIDQHQGISTTLSYRPTASFDVEEIFGAVIETGQIISLV